MTQSSNSVDLVFGASGYVGSNLVPFLLAQGRRVRAASGQSRPSRTSTIGTRFRSTPTSGAATRAD